VTKKTHKKVKIRPQEREYYTLEVNGMCNTEFSKTNKFMF